MTTQLKKYQVWKSNYYEGFYVIIRYDQNDATGIASGMLIGNGEPTDLAYTFGGIGQYYTLLADGSIPLWAQAVIWGMATKWGGSFYPPVPNMPEFDQMYKAWIDFGFADFQTLDE